MQQENDDFSYLGFSTNVELGDVKVKGLPLLQRKILNTVRA